MRSAMDNYSTSNIDHTPGVMMPTQAYACPVCDMKHHGKSAEPRYCNGVTWVSPDRSIGIWHEPVAVMPVQEVTS